MTEITSAHVAEVIGDGIIQGDSQVRFYGTLTGNLVVCDNALADIRGTVKGNLTVKDNAKVKVYGRIANHVLCSKPASVQVFGSVGSLGGDGELIIDKSSLFPGF